MKSQELNLNAIKNLSPSLFEKILGIIGFAAFIIQFYIKATYGTLIYIINPCHLLILMQSFLLLTKKTKFTSLVFISCQRWVFGAWLAVVFPDHGGYTSFEVGLFYVEHYIVAFLGVQTLIIFGRYGAYEGITSFLV